MRIVMHETSLGGTLRDYITGEARELTTYEDLRQALARFLVEERGYTPSALVPRLPVSYWIDGVEYVREADLVVLNEQGAVCALLLFCSGQVHTYQREAAALARLVRPTPSPLVFVTDMHDAELFAAHGIIPLATGLHALPCFEKLAFLAQANPCPCLTDEQRDKESRILHAYTGFLKTCCSEVCQF